MSNLLGKQTRSVKSLQRGMRMMALRIEGSTGTPSLEGPDQKQATIADTAVGTYTITLNSAFPDADSYIVLATVEGADKVATVTKSSASVFVVKVNDVDETPALSDDDVSVLIVGIDTLDHV
jgi:ABC-type lipoprotein release transport system permease subunit